MGNDGLQFRITPANDPRRDTEQHNTASGAEGHKDINMAKHISTDVESFDEEKAQVRESDLKKKQVFKGWLLFW